MVKSSRLNTYRSIEYDYRPYNDGHAIEDNWFTFSLHIIKYVSLIRSLFNGYLCILLWIISYQLNPKYNTVVQYILYGNRKYRYNESGSMPVPESQWKWRWVFKDFAMDVRVDILYYTVPSKHLMRIYYNIPYYTHFRLRCSVHCIIYVFVREPLDRLLIQFRWNSRVGLGSGSECVSARITAFYCRDYYYCFRRYD